MSTIKTKSFGSCKIAKCSPTKGKLTANTKVLNVKISFEEALKLNLALDECVRKLNKINRATTAGKRAAVNLTIHLSKDRIAILETKI